MLTRVDFSKEVFRWLFQPIYKRLLNYSLSYKDGNENLIKSHIITLIAGEPKVQLIVDLEELEIKGHCLFSLVHLTETTTCAILEQLEGTPEFLKEALTAVESIQEVIKLFIAASDTQARNLIENFEFSTFRVELIREVKRSDLEEN